VTGFSDPCIHRKRTFLIGCHSFKEDCTIVKVCYGCSSGNYGDEPWCIVSHIYTYM
jgi:hypothetical protein